ncbi:hypothetical protein HYQ44_013084 [Verticillium longisporum]|nr:hypothetical protein HYQ44_013084 [Verticillium longisporum]
MSGWRLAMCILHCTGAGLHWIRMADRCLSGPRPISRWPPEKESAKPLLATLLDVIIPVGVSYPLPSLHPPEVLRLAANPQWYDKRERGVPATACQGRHVRDCLRHKLRRLYPGAVLTLSFRVSGLEI